ncbi:MAG TPA: efflux RND transporter permease subunit, partial [Spirochaetia bacterium]|nr:efflux RND transporter permease subunit [Spirochaetia bacterium]
ILLGLALVAVLVLIHHPRFLFTLLLYPIVLSILHYLLRVVLALLEALTATLHASTEAGLSWIRDRYVSSLGRILRFSPWVLIGAALFFLFTIVFIMPKVPFSFVPQSDNGSLRAFIRMPNGTSTEATNSAVGRVERYLLSQPSVRTVQTVIGGGGVFGGANQEENARLQILLVPQNKRPSAFALIGRYRRAIRSIMKSEPGARAFVSAGGGFRGEGSSTTITLASPNFDLLNQNNNKVLALMQRNKWVGDATSSISRTTLENDFTPSTASLMGSGISPATLAQSLRVYTTGSQAGNVEIGGQSYPIMVQVDPRYLSGEQSLLSLPVYSPSLKTNLVVGQLGHFAPVEAPRELERYDRLYTAQYSLNLRRGAPPVLLFQHQIARELTRAGLLGNGVTISNGSRFGLAALTRQLSILGPEIFGLSILLAYLVMGAQFNSFRYPVYLLLPVPLALTGAIWVVFLLGSGLDVFGVMGMLMLIGLSAKNAILYLDFVVARLGTMPFIDALIDSARLRFRPIVMTTMTVLVISFPLIFSHGQGSEFGRRLGEVMLGGILFSAILTFFVVPSAFYLFERKRTALREQEGRRLSEIEEAAQAAARGSGV